jgi:hypothetical protein
VIPLNAGDLPPWIVPACAAIVIASALLAGVLLRVVWTRSMRSWLSASLICGVVVAIPAAGMLLTCARLEDWYWNRYVHRMLRESCVSGIIEYRDGRLDCFMTYPCPPSCEPGPDAAHVERGPALDVASREDEWNTRLITISTRLRGIEAASMVGIGCVLGTIGGAAGAVIRPRGGPAMDSKG